jgi:hypothetical protein
VISASRATRRGFAPRTIWKAAAVALALLAAGAYAVTDSQAATGPATIRISDQQRADTTLGSGLGAREIVRGGLYQRGRPRRPLGSSVLLCTYVGRSQRFCTAIFTLPKGTIVASGSVGESRLLYQLAIDGGTQLYDNARGTLTATTYSLRPRCTVLTFTLTG